MIERDYALTVREVILLNPEHSADCRHRLFNSQIGPVTDNQTHRWLVDKKDQSRMMHLFRILIVFNGINASQPESDSLNSEL